jgi:hypothetical protein
MPCAHKIFGFKLLVTFMAFVLCAVALGFCHDSPAQVADIVWAFAAIAGVSIGGRTVEQHVNARYSKTPGAIAPPPGEAL